jgi:hypothetical protein
MIKRDSGQMILDQSIVKYDVLEAAIMKTPWVKRVSRMLLGLRMAR